MPTTGVSSCSSRFEGYLGELALADLGLAQPNTAPIAVASTMVLMCCFMSDSHPDELCIPRRCHCMGQITQGTGVMRDVSVSSFTTELPLELDWRTTPLLDSVVVPARLETEIGMDRTRGLFGCMVKMKSISLLGPHSCRSGPRYFAVSSSIS